MNRGRDGYISGTGYLPSLRLWESTMTKVTYGRKRLCGAYGSRQRVSVHDSTEKACRQEQLRACIKNCEKAAEWTLEKV